jgi:hypothetical protein
VSQSHLRPGCGTLEHGYASTGHAAQGATVERAFVLLHDHGALQEWGYVACSRARTETHLYLTEQPPEREAHLQEPTITGAPERLARSLSASGAEPLALERSDAAHRASARAYAARKRELEQERVRAERRLADAEGKHDLVGWRRRGRRGAELRTEIALQRAALRLAEQRLAEQTHAPTTEPLRAKREAVAPARNRLLQNRLARELCSGRARLNVSAASGSSCECDRDAT